jgi:hypothetical protein
MKHFRTVPQESLKYIIWDCQQALEAMPDNPKAEQYKLDVCTGSLPDFKNIKPNCEE